MRIADCLLVLALILPGAACAPAPRTAEAAEETSVVLRVSRLLDGRGGVLEDRSIVVREGRIAEIVEGEVEGPARVYDLRGLTLLPGLIDTHVHMSWHFDRETGKLHSRDSEETPAQAMLYAVENAYTTLLGGVTTVQSLGSPEDGDLRDFIARARGSSPPCAPYPSGRGPRTRSGPSCGNRPRRERT